MNDNVPILFSFQFGQRVQVKEPHQDAGASGRVTNAYLFNDDVEEVFVAIPGGQGVYHASDLEAAPTTALLYQSGRRGLVSNTVDGFTMIAEAVRRLRAKGDIILE